MDMDLDPFNTASRYERVDRKFLCSYEQRVNRASHFVVQVSRVRLPMQPELRVRVLDFHSPDLHKSRRNFADGLRGAVISFRTLCTTMSAASAKIGRRDYFRERVGPIPADTGEGLSIPTCTETTPILSPMEEPVWYFVAAM